jgi:membrane-associated phospholipid phosphatase
MSAASAGSPPPAATGRLARRLAQAAAAAAGFAVPVVLLFLLVRSANPTVAELDANAHDALRGTAVDRPALGDVMAVVAVVADPWVLRVGAAAGAVVLWRRGRRRVALWLVTTFAIGGLLSAGLKVLVARARPVFPDPIAHAGGYSFPSGHALTAMVGAGCAVVLLHPRLRGRARALLWVAAGAFALLVGLDRVFLGVHYLTDVVAGWVVGLATVVSTVVAFAVWRRQEGLPPATPGAELAAGTESSPDKP